jgi:hypothetical protein
VIDKQGVLTEVMLRLSGFYEVLESPNKILVSLLQDVGQSLYDQLVIKVTFRGVHNFL